MKELLQSTVNTAGHCDLAFGSDAADEIAQISAHDCINAEIMQRGAVFADDAFRLLGGLFPPLVERQPLFGDGDKGQVFTRGSQP